MHLRTLSLSDSECVKHVQHLAIMQDKPFGVNLTILPALIPADALPKNAREKNCFYTRAW